MPNLKQWRVFHKLTIKKASKLLGIPENQYILWEKTGIPKETETIVDLACAAISTRLYGWKLVVDYD